MKTELLDEFIAFSREKFGVTVKVVKSDMPDSFEKIFGDSFSHNMELEYKRETGQEISFEMNSVYEHASLVNLDSAA